jgi:hypothetical protein
VPEETPAGYGKGRHAMIGHPIDWSKLGEDYERLGTAHAVAETYGCTYSAVMKALKRKRIAIRPRYPHNWDDLADDLREMGSARAVARAYGCAATSVNAQVRKRSIRYMPALEKTGGKCADGRRAELLALQLLPGAADLNARRLHARSDLFWNGSHVDVKSARLRCTDGGQRWRFQLNGKRDSSHFVLCLGFDENGRELLVAWLLPTWAVLHQSISIPRRKRSSYNLYVLPIPLEVRNG